MVKSMENLLGSAELQKRLRSLLFQMYGTRSEEAYLALSSRMAAYKERHACASTPAGVNADDMATAGSAADGIPSFNEKDALLISYGDMIAPPAAGGGEGGLSRLADFLERQAPGLFSYLHILPFCPYSSDDGFSVKDYRAVDPALGSWRDIQALGRERKLVFDLVLNHASAQGDWFKAFLAGREPYSRFFIVRPLDYDASGVTRPRTHPLITPMAMDDGEVRGLWTTFSADQVDLDFSEPAVLAEFVDILLFYAEQGARMVRLDAIAYLWKEDGTNCVHLPQTHAAVKLFRLVAELLGLDLALLTETNVPHEENMSYFGEGDEAHMVYNFSLPPLVLHAFISEDADALARWAQGLTVPAGGTLLNFLASHDGIGVTPAKGLVSDFSPVLRGVEARGGLISYKATPEGPVPYELNISWADAVAPVGAADEERAEALLASYAVACAMDGVPALYFHSLVGSRSWTEGPVRLGYNRAINRQRPRADELEAALAEPGSLRSRALCGFSSLLAARARHPAFAPSSPRRALPAQGPVFLVERGAGAGRILVLINCSPRPARAELPEGWRGAARVINPFAVGEGPALPGAQTLALPPYAVRWVIA
jgi:glucosylglycerate phosphorylase